MDGGTLNERLNIPCDEETDFDEQAWLRKQQVDEVLRQLPQPCREVLVLHEMGYEEIAQALGIPVGTLRLHLHLPASDLLNCGRKRSGRDDHCCQAELSCRHAGR
ncbi:MAG: sigma-70 family RNA polymerase sigma factor [Armatimonadetes bacterium]|nr:sigma-70 family RNA polymerase sigma factor [Armatimonadota bacterium]